jgi:Transport and Golgi organisation 2
MCTVSFLPNRHGFYLAMNRDEKLDRFSALPPGIADLGKRRAVFPREPTGGTWISANDAGVCLALINWHRVQREPKHDVVSRGLIVRELAGKISTDEIANGLKKLPLRKLRPFRLIAVVPFEKTVTEWLWNLDRFTMHNHRWRRQHWFSSGLDERTVERVRAKVCASFVAGGDDPGKTQTSWHGKRTGGNAAGYNLSWLRKLHRSHSPKRGPFSICMHRPGASTVSYTEVAVSPRRATMRYKPGQCCADGTTVSKAISLAHPL